MSRGYRQQGGWVASFVVVGVLLTLATLGGLYYLKNYQKQLAKTDRATTSSQTATTIPGNANKNNQTGAEDKSKNTEKPEIADMNNSTTAPRSTTNSRSSDTSPSQPSTQQQDSSSSTPSPSTSGTATPTTPPAVTEKLPSTGPEDTVINAAILGILTFSAVTYVRSRQLA